MVSERYNILCGEIRFSIPSRSIQNIFISDFPSELNSFIVYDGEADKILLMSLFIWHF